MVINEIILTNITHFSAHYNISRILLSVILFSSLFTHHGCRSWRRPNLNKLHFYFIFLVFVLSWQYAVGRFTRSPLLLSTIDCFIWATEFFNFSDYWWYIVSFGRLIVSFTTAIDCLFGDPSRCQCHFCPKICWPVQGCPMKHWRCSRHSPSRVPAMPHPAWQYIAEYDELCGCTRRPRPSDWPGSEHTRAPKREARSLSTIDPQPFAFSLLASVYLNCASTHSTKSNMCELRLRCSWHQCRKV